MPTTAITFALIAGLLTTVITSLINRVNWPSKVKVYVSAGTAVVLTVAAVIFQIFPAAWETVAATIAAVFGVAQAVYPVLKPLLKRLEYATTGETALTDELDDFFNDAVAGIEIDESDEVEETEEVEELGE